MSEIRFANILEADDHLKEKVRQWRNSPAVRKYMIKRHIIAKQEHAAWLKKLNRTDKARFWIVFADGAPIGAAYLHDIDCKKMKSEWGFYIGERNYRGKGLSRLILFQLLDKAFEEVRLDALRTKVVSVNKTALHIYESMGFREIGRASQKDGAEIMVLEFLKEDWRALKKDAKHEFVCKS